MYLIIKDRIDVVWFILTCLSTLENVFFVTGIETQDYCEWETFNPQCSENEVIIVQKAIFGIMEIGRCIEKDYGFLGCSSDHLAFVDQLCSGQKQCDLPVSSKVIKNRITCPDHYLQASYICQTVMTHQKCYQPLKIDVKYTKSYLASISTRDTMCGSGNTPWVLQAQPGQMINLTLIDFAWGEEIGHQSNKCQRPYGHILRYDNNDMQEICGGLIRENHIGLIKSHQVQIVLQESAVQTYSFLIRYEAIGCHDIVPPKNAWMSKDGNDVTIGCHTSSDTWKLKCVGNHWIGVVGNCSRATIKPIPVEKEHFTTHHVSAVGVGCFALIVCCVTITIGVYCIRRYKVKLKSRCSSSMATDMCLLPSKQNTVNMRTLSNTITTVPRRQGSINQTLPHPELQGLHMCGPNCNCTLRKPDQQNDQITDDSVLYYVLEQPEPPIYENNNSGVNVTS